MSLFNNDLQKENNQLNMKVNMNDSAFQKIFDKICFFHKLLLRMKE